MKYLVKKNKLIWLCYLTIFSFVVLGNAFTINFGERFPIKISEMLAILLNLIYFAKYHSISLKKHEIYILFWIIFVSFISVITTVRYKFSTTELLYGLSYPLRLILLLLTANIISAILKRNCYKKEKIMRFILNCYLLVCFIGFFQFIFFPVAFDFYSLFTQIGFYIANPDPHINRLISLYFDPNYLASCLIIPFTIVFLQWKNGEKSKIWYLLIFGISIALTVSRSGFLGVAIIIVLSFCHLELSKNTILKNIIIIASVVTVCIILFTSNASIVNRILNSNSDASTFARFRSWEYGFEIIKDNLFVGIGYNMIGAYREKVLHQIASLSTGYGNDSSLLVIVICSGIVGIIYFIICALKLGFNRSNKISKIEREILVLIFCSSIIICNFNNLLFYVIWLFPVLLVSNIFIDLD